jgi:radical SAM protein with 4Fe4S-binding SPASM domain
MDLNAPQRFTLTRQWFGSLVFDHRTARYLPFDHESTELLITSLTHPFGTMSHGDDDDAIAAFVSYFYREGLLTHNLQFSGTVQSTEPLPRTLTGPLSLHLEVIARCNLTCSHCFAGDLPRKSEPLSLAELDALFADLSSMGCFRLSLTGGEPLMRRDLFAVIDLALAHRLRPSITSNGLLLTEQIVRELAKRDLLWLNISVDGTHAQTNDLVRGDATFGSVLKKLELLRDRVPFSLAFTVMKHNASDASQLAELALSVGASGAVVRPLYPVGIAAEHPELMPSFEQYQQALIALAGHRSDGAEPEAPREVFSPQSRRATSSKLTDHFGCGAGTTTASVSVDGVVSPCSFLGVEFATQSIRERSFQAIWRDAARFVELRDFAQNAAENPFSGGCRARAKHFNGSAFAADPWVHPDAFSRSLGESRMRLPLLDQHAPVMPGLCGTVRKIE